jgi:hypothetical protein
MFLDKTQILQWALQALGDEVGGVIFLGLLSSPTAR